MNQKNLIVVLGGTLCFGLIGCADKPSDAKKPETKTTAKSTTTKPKVGAKKTPPKLDIKPKSVKAPAKFDARTIARTKFTKQQIILPTADTPMVIDGNPYLSEGRAVKLQWMEQPKSFKLHSTYDEKSKIVGTIKLKQEENLDYDRTRLIINKPRPFNAKANDTVKPFGPKFYKLDASKHMGIGEEIPSFDVKKGQELRLYHFFPSGNCLLGLMEGKKEIFYKAACPDVSQFTSKFIPRDYASPPMKPIESQWWFEVKKGDQKGWLRIDKTMLIPHLKRLDVKTGLFQKSAPSPTPKEGLGTNLIKTPPKTSPNTPPVPKKEQGK